MPLNTSIGLSASFAESRLISERRRSAEVNEAREKDDDADLGKEDGS